MAPCNTTPEAQVCITVPGDAKPGETILDVYVPSRNGDPNLYTCLQVKLPSEILPGQTMVVSKLDADWSVGRAGFPLPDHITAVVPKDAIPGVSCMPITYKGVEVTRVQVPDRAKPEVDEVRVGRPCFPGEPWSLTLQVDPDYPQLVKDMAIGAAQASLRAPPLHANTAYERLVEAVTQAGGYVNNKMIRGRAPPLNIPGLVASEDIAEGDVICQIPRDLHFSPATVEAAAPAIWESTTALIKPKGLNLRAEEAVLNAMCARMLHEAEDRAVARQQDPSTEPPSQSGWLSEADPKIRRLWEAYMDQLLGEDFTQHPIRRVGEDPEAIKSLLQPSCLVTHMYKEIKCIHTLYRIVAGVSQNSLGSRFEPGMFLRSFLNFQSRQFKAAVSRSLVPIADLLNHAPLVDTNVAWGYDPVAQAHILKAVRAIATGDELLQSYGPHPNVCFYRCYNFTLPPHMESSWCYSLWKEDHPDVFTTFVPPSSGANNSEVHLSSSEVSESLREVLRDIAQVGGNPAFFLRVICAKLMKPFEKSASLQPALESLRRAREKDPCSCAWWQCLEETDMALADDEAARIQMCEYLCLASHKEAIDLVANERLADGCLASAYVMRIQLVELIVQLHQEFDFK